MLHCHHRARGRPGTLCILTIRLASAAVYTAFPPSQIGRRAYVGYRVVSVRWPQSGRKAEASKQARNEGPKQGGMLFMGNHTGLKGAVWGNPTIEKMQPKGVTKKLVSRDAVMCGSPFPQQPERDPRKQHQLRFGRSAADSSNTHDNCHDDTPNTSQDVRLRGSHRL